MVSSIKDLNNNTYTGSGSGSRTDSNVLAVLGLMLELNKIFWRFRVQFSEIFITDPVFGSVPLLD